MKFKRFKIIILPSGKYSTYFPEFPHFITEQKPIYSKNSASYTITMCQETLTEFN